VGKYSILCYDINTLRSMELGNTLLVHWSIKMRPRLDVLFRLALKDSTVLDNVV
jgi:hypothetical protein